MRQLRTVAMPQRPPDLFKVADPKLPCLCCRNPNQGRGLCLPPPSHHLLFPSASQQTWCFPKWPYVAWHSPSSHTDLSVSSFNHLHKLKSCRDSEDRFTPWTSQAEDIMGSFFWPQLVWDGLLSLTTSRIQATYLDPQVLFQTLDSTSEYNDSFIANHV